MHYKVIFSRVCVYNVCADNADEAVDMAVQLHDEPYDMIYAEEVEE